MNKTPLITVITVVYNGGRTLEKTIQSVVSQSYRNFEYIIIDGASDDDTVDVIKRYDKNITYWVSENDSGIYEAMNKGIDQARGLYTIFVNSGDYLYDTKVFENIVGSLDDAVEYDMIYGRSKTINSKGDVSDLIVYHPVEQLWKGPCFRHGALLAKTSLLKQNKFELSQELKIAADFDFIYKIYKKGYRFHPVNTVILAFLEEGASSDPYKHLKDCIYILKKHKDWNVRTSLYYLYRYCRLGLSHSMLRYPYKGLSMFFQNYFANYWINKIPFYYIRHLYYRKVMRITMGKGSSIHLNCFFYGTNISIAENSTINRRCFLDGRGKIFIGNRVSISPEVHLITEDHDYNTTNFSGRSRDIVIEDYVWIGTRAIILPGINIGRGAVICAGAVVTKNVEEFSVVAGVPAKKIKERNRDLNYNPSWLPFFD